MKNILLACILLLSVTSINAQVLSVEKLASFTVAQIDSMIVGAVPIPGLIQAEHPVDLYKIVYLTPYIHPDSLVRASMAVAFPVNSQCEFPLVGYGHGTQADHWGSASNMAGAQWDVNCIFASTGYTVSMPDYLGLGDPDPRVVIHPYTHAYSQANTTINALRASRHLCDSLDILLNGQVFLYGYSQGGGATVAAVKEIQENYTDEFDIAGAAPMSGAYDLIDAQVDLIASDSIYPTPGYLPYVVLAYQSIYGNLFNDPSEFLKSPYDTLIPPLFYEGNTGIGTLNNLCTPVPKDIVKDSVMNAFLTDSLHSLRVQLRENDLIRGWFPTVPMMLIYCEGDDQVTYLNSEVAYDSWVEMGADTNLLVKENFGSLNHGDCAPFAILAGKSYFDSLRMECDNTGVAENSDIGMSFELAPNPANNEVRVSILSNHGQSVSISLINLLGEVVQRGSINGRTQSWEMDISGRQKGIYLVRTTDGNSVQTKKLIIN
ncbi:MAG: pimeloyl-ACP methyl ester carboxylesterase [Granulosicoccus sp.]|jgi:pimeloyl-ACP methyl ester carboxylesterase